MWFHRKRNRSAASPAMANVRTAIYRSTKGPFRVGLAGCELELAVFQANHSQAQLSADVLGSACFPTQADRVRPRARMQSEIPCNLCSRWEASRKAGPVFRFDAEFHMANALSVQSDVSSEPRSHVTTWRRLNQFRFKIFRPVIEPNNTLYHAWNFVERCDADYSPVTTV